MNIRFPSKTRSSLFAVIALKIMFMIQAVCDLNLWGLGCRMYIKNVILTHSNSSQISWDHRMTIYLPLVGRLHNSSLKELEERPCFFGTTKPLP